MDLKTCSTLVFLTHTILQLNSNGRFLPTSNEGFGDPHIPSIYDIPSNSLPIVSKKKNDADEEEEKENENNCMSSRVGVPLQVLDWNLGGACGAYLVEDMDGEQGVFKPLSAEGAEANKAPLKRGVVLGETIFKEIAAFQLGFDLDVPRTTPLTPTLKGLSTGEPLADEFSSLSSFGSLQKYIPHTCSAEDMGPSAFSVDEIQKIGILDIRLLNLDRHLNNLLVVTEDNVNKLIPIDHGYILPSYQDMSDVYFGWTYWKQCKESWSDRSKNIISRLRPLQDAELLSSLGISSESILPCVLASLLLQHAVNKDISLYRLAVFLQSDMATDAQSGFQVAVIKTVSAAIDVSHFDWTKSTQLPSSEWYQLVQNFLGFVDESV